MSEISEEIHVDDGMRSQQQTLWTLTQRLTNSNDDIDEDGRGELHSAAGLGKHCLSDCKLPTNLSEPLFLTFFLIEHRKSSTSTTLR